MTSSFVTKWGRWRIAWLSRDSLNAVAELLNARDIDGVGLSPHHGFEGDVALLDRLPSYTGLVITDTDMVSYNRLPNLQDMRFLSFGGTRSHGFHFAGFRNLEDLRLSWNSRDTLPDGSAPLKSLYLKGYAPRTRDLTEIPKYRDLSSLELVQANLTSMEGAQRFDGLRDVDVSYCKKLNSVAALAATAVERVHLEGCAHIVDIPLLARCAHLKSIRLSNCGTIDSLEFLRESKTIEEFRFVKTNVRDGDMTPLLRLRSVGFLNQRGYSHTCEQVNESIRVRGA